MNALELMILEAVSGVDRHETREPATSKGAAVKGEGGSK